MNPDDTAMPTATQRQEMIAIAAYFLAEQRGFAPGGAEADWLTAERLIDSLIAERKLSLQSDVEARGAQIRYALKLATSSCRA